MLPWYRHKHSNLSSSCRLNGSSSSNSARKRKVKHVSKTRGNALGDKGGWFS